MQDWLRELHALHSDDIASKELTHKLELEVETLRDKNQSLEAANSHL